MRDEHSLGTKRTGRTRSTGGRGPSAGKAAILVIDIGGTHIKVAATGHPQAVRIPTGKTFTAARLTRAVKSAAKDWKYDVISIGYPGVVAHERPVHEPHNMAKGWVGYDFSKAFGRPIKMLNDAAMQAAGDYEGGRMLFLGLGTGLGSAMIVEGLIEPMELGHLPYRHGKSYEDYIGVRGLKKLGRAKWEKHVHKVVAALRAALEPDSVVLGGGNVLNLRKLPPDTRLGDNSKAILGGFRMWQAAFGQRIEKNRKQSSYPAKA